MMFFVKVFLVVATICGTTQADMISNIPFVGGVLGTVANASKSVLNTAVDAVQVTGGQIIGRNIFETQIVNRIRVLLQELKKLMIDQIPLLGLPKLEPYDHGHVDINITHEIGIFEGTMDNVVVIGLSGFDVEDITAKINSRLPFKMLDPNITIDLYYEHLDITGLYDIKAFVGDLFNIWGKGNFDLRMHGLKIKANVLVIVELFEKQIRIEDIAVDIKLANMTCNFENLMGGGEIGDLFNKVIGELAPEAVEVLWPEIRPGLEAKIKEVANIKITELGYEEVLAILLPFLKPKPVL